MNEVMCSDYRMSNHRHPLGVVGTIDDQALENLARTIDGDLILPDSEEYEDGRNVWNGLINTYPAIIVRVADEGDVASAIAFAREQGLELSIRGGAHHQAGVALVEGGLVIDLEDMDRIEVDPDAQVVTVQPGTRAEDVLAATQEYGLACPTGSAGDVGIPGSTLGGGIGWIRRKHGLAIDALRRVELVTADGERVEASPERNAELFWAVRGGGGNFGVVTTFEFDCYEVGPMVQALGIFYPEGVAEDVLEVYRDVMADAPAELTTILLDAHVPGLPPMPDELVGKPAVGILGCYAGDPEEGESVIEPLRNIAEPYLDLSDVMPYQMLHDLGTQMFPWGRKYCHRSVFVDDLSDDVLEVIRDCRVASPTPMNALGVWPLGGNVGHGPASAFAWDDKSYMITVEANWEAVDNVAVLEWARESERRLREAGAEGAYAGFTGVEEQEWEDWSQQVYGDSYDRLVEVKSEYDPENVFSRNVNVS